MFGVYRPTREFFTHMETSPLPVTGILTYTRHSWPLSSEGSLTWHTYCDTVLPFIMVISEDPWHSHLLPSVRQWSCHYLFLRLGSVAIGDRTPISRTRGERSNSTPPRRLKKSIYTCNVRQNTFVQQLFVYVINAWTEHKIQFIQEGHSDFVSET